MKDRIKQLMDDQHLTQQSFAQLIGSTPATLSNIFNGKTNPSLSIVDGIHKSFPQVNVYWILYGTPPMYNSQEAQKLLLILVRLVVLAPLLPHRFLSSLKCKV